MRFTIFAFLLGAFVCFIEAKPAQERLEQVEDMIMTPEQKEFYDQIKNGRARRDAIKDKWLWPKGKVYYVFSKGLSKAGKNLAKDAMKHWEEKTCLKFEDIDSMSKKPKYYAEFKFGGDCRAMIGFTNRP
ncbi:nematocyst expressed protein 6-like, partial [Exaiptasia diaphana]|uniref:Peptidase M12A domain-containing protein n=1 Tax=Exaiptasia diaphana TaxID=2652724 RepID=A0A913XCX6_EXADI